MVSSALLKEREGAKNSLSSEWGVITSRAKREEMVRRDGGGKVFVREGEGSQYFSRGGEGC